MPSTEDLPKSDKKPTPFHELAIALLGGDEKVCDEFAAIIKGITGSKSQEALACLPEFAAAMLVKIRIPEEAKPQVISALARVLTEDQDEHFYEAVKYAIIVIGGEDALREALEQSGYSSNEAIREVEGMRGYVRAAL